MTGSSFVRVFGADLDHNTFRVFNNLYIGRGLDRRRGMTTRMVGRCRILLILHFLLKVDPAK